MLKAPKGGNSPVCERIAYAFEISEKSIARGWSQFNSFAYYTHTVLETQRKSPKGVPFGITPKGVIAK